MGLLLIFVTFCTDLIFALRLIGLINDPIYEFQKKKSVVITKPRTLNHNPVII